MNTTELRANFLIQDLMKQDQINLVYSHYDRMIVGGVVPGKNKIDLANEGELKANYFLERRELGIINVGGKGTVTADGVDYVIDKLECVYLGKGTEHVSFASNEASNPALFYLLSTPAHHTYPNQKMTKADAAPVKLGELATSNKRTIYKYIHNDGIHAYPHPRLLFSNGPNLPPVSKECRLAILLRCAVQAEARPAIGAAFPPQMGKYTLKYTNYRGFRTAQAASEGAKKL